MEKDFYAVIIVNLFLGVDIVFVSSIKNFQEETGICYACEAKFDRAARKIQKWFRRHLIAIRVHYIAISQRSNEIQKRWAAETIVAFFKMIQAKRYVRDIRRRIAREKFLKRFD